MKRLVIADKKEDGKIEVVLCCKKPPPQILKQIADLLNSYIDPQTHEFIDVEYFGVKVNETSEN